MKIHISMITLALGLSYSQVSAQQTYKGEPLILANTEKADVALGKKWFVNAWRISPEIANDTLKIKLYNKSERISFRTDQDSISFDIKAGESKSFYVKMQNAEPAHTIISTSKYKWDNVVYADSKKRDDLRFYYENAKTTYSDSLRKEYPLGR